MVDRNNGPYMVLLWTSHGELEDYFRQYVAELDWPPVQTCVLRKADVRDDNGEFNLEVIIEAIVAQLTKVDPLHLMMLWGQAVHDAASATLESVGPSNADDWITEVRHLLGALVRENTPRAHLADLGRCLRALFEALDQVHADHLEAAALPLAIESSAAIAAVAEAAAARNTTNASLLSHINRNLLLGPVVNNDAPGTVYFLKALPKPLQSALAALPADTLEPQPVGAKASTKPVVEHAHEHSVILAVELTPALRLPAGQTPGHTPPRRSCRSRDRSQGVQRASGLPACLSGDGIRRS